MRKAGTSVFLALSVCILFLASVTMAEEAAGFANKFKLSDKSAGFGLKSSTRDIEFDSGETMEAEQLLFLLRGQVLVSENIDAYILLGLGSVEVSDFNLTYEELPFTVVGKSFDGGSGLAWGGGAEYTMPKTLFDVTTAIGFQLLYFTSEMDSSIGAPLNVEGSLTERVKWLEYGLEASISKTFGKLEPYGGVGITKVSGKMEGEETIGSLSGTESKDFSESDLFGAFGGVNYSISESLLINAEMRLIDEAAFVVSAQWSF